MPKAYSDYTKQAVIYVWSAVADNNRPLHIPRRSSRIDPIIGSILDHRIDLRKSIIYNRIDERCARVDYCPRRHTVSNRPIYRENCSRSLGVENSRNGTDRATERSGPCNGTKRTVERNGTDRFTPFLGKRYRRATQTERTVFRTFFRRVPYICLISQTSFILLYLSVIHTAHGGPGLEYVIDSLQSRLQYHKGS